MPITTRVPDTPAVFVYNCQRSILTSLTRIAPTPLTRIDDSYLTALQLIVYLSVLLFEYIRTEPGVFRDRPTNCILYCSLPSYRTTAVLPLETKAVS